MKRGERKEKEKKVRRGRGFIIQATDYITSFNIVTSQLHLVVLKIRLEPKPPPKTSTDFGGTTIMSPQLRSWSLTTPITFAYHCSLTDPSTILVAPTHGPFRVGLGRCDFPPRACNALPLKQDWSRKFRDWAHYQRDGHQHRDCLIHSKRKHIDQSAGETRVTVRPAVASRAWKE